VLGPAPGQPGRVASRASGPASAHLIERIANDRSGRLIDELARDRIAQRDAPINPADRTATEPNIEIIDKRKRTWPRQIGGGASAPRRTTEELERDTTAGWEP